MNARDPSPAESTPDWGPAAQAMYRAAQAVSRPGGPAVFAQLVRDLADILDVATAFVAVFTDASRGELRTLAAVLDGKPLRSFDYVLEGSPCAQVVGHAYRYVARGVSVEFRPDTIFAVKGMDSYAAFPLFDSADAPLGLLVAMDRRAIADATLAEALLKIFAGRIVAEIEQRRAHDALRRSEASYRAIFESAEVAIFIHDWDSGAVLDANPKACTTYGYSPEEMRRVSLADTSSGIPPYTAEHGLHYIEQAKQGLDPVFEWHRRNKDGSLHWDEVRLKVARIDGKPHVLAFTHEITQRKAAEALLRASEEQYRAIFDASADPLILWDSRYRRVDVNPAYERVFGWTRDEVIGRSWDRPDDGEPYAGPRRELVRRALAGETCRAELTSRRKDGTLIQVEVHATPFRHRGEPHVLAIARDVTERRRAEERLRAREEQYRAIFDGSVDPMVLWSRSLHVVDVNAAFEQTTGLHRDQVVGRHWSERPDAEEMRRLLPSIEQALAGEMVHRVESVTRADGSAFDIELRYLPVCLGGEPFALGIGRDVSERLERERRLLASEEQYRAIFDASVDGMLLMDAEHRVVDVNQAFLSLHGYERDEVVRQHNLRVIPPDLEARCVELLPRILGGEPQHIEARGRRRDGSEFDAEVHGVPMRYQGHPHVLVIMRDVTKARRAAAELRASEEQYRAIFNASADALVLRDAGFRIVDVNAAYERMSGWTRDEVLGLDRIVANPPEVAPAIRALHERTLGGEPVVLEVPLVRRDGTRYEIELRGMPIRHRGEPHVLYIGRDVTERKRAERALRDSEEQYRAIFNASADALMLWNSRLQRVDVNPAHQKIFGFAREEVVGRGFEGLPYPEEFVRPRLDAVRRALQGEASRAELEAIRKDGRRIVTELRTIPFTQRGEAHVLQIARDITESRTAEARLRTSEEQYRAIFNASADALVLRNADYRAVDVNPAYLAMSGFTRDEVLAAPRVLTQPDESLRRAHRALHDRAVAGETLRFETQGMRKDGTRFDAEVRGVPVLYRGAPHVLYATRDITERRAAEVERAALEAQLRQAQKMEAIGQLTGGIAHDFNNILTAVIGYLVLGQERAAAGNDPKLVRQLESAHLAAQRARDLIAQMLTFARRPGGEHRALAPGPLVRQSLQLLRSTLPSSVLLEAQIDDDEALPAVQADAVQLEQVLFNLCINARDAMDGSGTIRVDLRAVHHPGLRCTSCGASVGTGPWVELGVADSGSGIAPDVMERMFEPFFSTKAVGRGSGMGLAMVHGIVHNHGGHVVVTSEPGCGSRFAVLWPLAAADSVVDAPARPARGVAERRLAGRVMVVEDEPQVGELMAELLAGWGLQVVSMHDPLVAREWLEDRANTIDLLLTDHTMPQMTGIQLAQHATAARPMLPVLLYTGDPETQETSVLNRHGVRALLRKPIEPQALRALLQRWLPPR